MKTILLLLALVFTSFVQARTWTESASGRTLTGDFVKATDTTVTGTRDGKPYRKMIDIPGMFLDNTAVGGGTAGNPNLKPVRSTNIDANLEWYFAPRAYASVGAFHMDFGSYITNGTFRASYPVLLGNTGGFVTFDFSAGVKKDNWTFDVFMQNAFDRRGLTTRNTFCSITFCSGSSRAFPVKPQFFGARFGQKF